MECPVTGEQIEIEVGLDGPPAGLPWFVHFDRPAIRWWDNVIDT
jgi:hypothetical protein